MRNLLSNEVDLFSFFEITPDLVCVAGKDGFFKKVNQSVINKLGYTAEEIYGKHISSFIYAEDVEKTFKLREDMLQSGKPLISFVNRYVTKSGEIVWLEWTSIYLTEKELVFAIAKDVTERKLAEIEVEIKFKNIKRLATHFKSDIEKDRKYLSTELREELAQLVSALKMDIDWIAHYSLELSETAKKKANHALAVSNLLIKSIQRISFAISPKMLDDFGLNASLERLFEEFTIQNNIPCHFESVYNETDLTQEMKMDFFRICQEALTNVLDHAGANQVNVCIEESNETIRLMITDNGKGFDVDQKNNNHGLISMVERANSINGELHINSKPGEGTQISLSVSKVMN